MEKLGGILLYSELYIVKLLWGYAVKGEETVRGGHLPNDTIEFEVSGD